MGTLTEGNVLKDRYRIVEVKDEYADLTVYKAKDQAAHNNMVYIREVDLKARGYKTFTQQTLDFLVSILSTTSHVGLPKFVEFFQGIESGYIIEEYVTGNTMEECLEMHGGPYSFNEAYNWMIQLCDLIHYLHSREKQVIIRGLTPQVIKITPNGDLKLINLDKARFFNPVKETADTVFVWNPGYTSPEQYGTQKSDVRADVYGFGAVFYHLFTNQNLNTMHFNFPPVSQFNHSFTSEQDAIIAKCLDKDIYSRYQSILAVKQDIARLNPHKKEEVEVVVKKPRKKTLKERIKNIGRGFRDWVKNLNDWLWR